MVSSAEATNTNGVGGAAAPTINSVNQSSNVEELSEALPRVQLRNKNRAAAGNGGTSAQSPTTQAAGGAAKPPAPSVNNKEQKPAAEAPRDVNGMAQSALERAMGTLYEGSPDMEDNNEEIRRLDTQLDHLNEYMEKVEKRLNEHNEKLKETLRQQREDRERRRQSFHERLESNRQEDTDFQKQLDALLNQIVQSKQKSALAPKTE